MPLPAAGSPLYTIVPKAQAIEGASTDQSPWKFFLRGTKAMVLEYGQNISTVTSAFLWEPNADGTVTRGASVPFHTATSAYPGLSHALLASGDAAFVLQHDAGQQNCTLYRFTVAGTTLTLASTSTITIAAGFFVQTIYFDRLRERFFVTSRESASPNRVRVTVVQCTPTGHTASDAVSPSTGFSFDGAMATPFRDNEAWLASYSSSVVNDWVAMNLTTGACTPIVLPAGTDNTGGAFLRSGVEGVVSNQHIDIPAYTGTLGQTTAPPIGFDPDVSGGVNPLAGETVIRGYGKIGDDAGLVAIMLAGDVFDATTHDYGLAPPPSVEYLYWTLSSAEQTAGGDWLSIGIWEDDFGGKVAEVVLWGPPSLPPPVIVPHHGEHVALFTADPGATETSVMLHGVDGGAFAVPPQPPGLRPATVSMQVQVASETEVWTQFFIQWYGWDGTNLNALDLERVGRDYRSAPEASPSVEDQYTPVNVLANVPDDATHWRPILLFSSTDPAAGDPTPLPGGTKVYLDCEFVPDNGRDVTHEPYLSGDEPGARWEGAFQQSPSVYGSSVTEVVAPGDVHYPDWFPAESYTTEIQTLGFASVVGTPTSAIKDDDDSTYVEVRGDIWPDGTAASTFAFLSFPPQPGASSVILRIRASAPARMAWESLALSWGEDGFRDAEGKWVGVGEVDVKTLTYTGTPPSPVPAFGPVDLEIPLLSTAEMEAARAGLLVVMSSPGMSGYTEGWRLYEASLVVDTPVS